MEPALVPALEGPPTPATHKLRLHSCPKAPGALGMSQAQGWAQETWRCLGTWKDSRGSTGDRGGAE